MSFGLSSLKPQAAGLERLNMSEGSCGVPNILTCGLQATKSKLEPTHPLHISEMKYAENREQMNMAMLRNAQGLHAPLRLKMEREAAKKVGRLPFLPSSGLMNDVLTGRDEEIGFEDILNTAEFREQLVQPHAFVERHLGSL